MRERHPHSRLRDFWGRFDQARTSPELRAAARLLRLQHARDLAAIFRDAHRTGKCLGHREAERIHLDADLRIVFVPGRVIGSRSTFASDDETLGRILTAVLGSVSKTGFCGEVADFLNGNGQPPSAVAWFAELSRTYGRLRSQAVLGGPALDPTRVWAAVRSVQRTPAAGRHTRVVCSAVLLLTLLLTPPNEQPPRTESRPAGMLLQSFDSHQAPPTGSPSTVPQSPDAQGVSPTGFPPRIDPTVVQTEPVAVVAVAPPPKLTASRPADGFPAPPTANATELEAQWGKLENDRAVIYLRRGQLSTTIELVRMKKGSFTLGSDDGEDDERPSQPVKVEEEFYLAKFETTVEQLDFVLRTTTTGPGGSRNLPACAVDRDTAREACKKIKTALGSQVREVRLPWEFEWEYAARTGRLTIPKEVSALETFAWVGDKKPAVHPVGEKKPDAQGVHDLFGNVAEWVEDGYDPHAYKRDDPRKVSKGIRGVVRGGSSQTPTTEISPSRREAKDPDSKDPFVGFRIVVVP